MLCLLEHKSLPPRTNRMHWKLGWSKERGVTLRFVMHDAAESFRGTFLSARARLTSGQVKEEHQSPTQSTQSTHESLGHTTPPLGQYPSAYYIILYSSTQPSCISHNYIINQLKSCFMRVSNMLQHQQSLATAGQSVHPAQKLHKPQLILEFWFSFDFPPQYASITDLELLVIETIHTRSSMTFRKFSSHSYIVLR